MEDERNTGMSPADWLMKELERIAKLKEKNGWDDDHKHVKMLEKAMWSTFKAFLHKPTRKQQRQEEGLPHQGHHLPLGAHEEQDLGKGLDGRQGEAPRGPRWSLAAG